MCAADGATSMLRPSLERTRDKATYACPYCHDSGVRREALRVTIPFSLLFVKTYLEGFLQVQHGAVHAHPLRLMHLRQERQRVIPWREGNSGGSRLRRTDSPHARSRGNCVRCATTRPATLTLNT